MYITVLYALLVLLVAVLVNTSLCYIILYKIYSCVVLFKMFTLLQIKYTYIHKNVITEDLGIFMFVSCYKYHKCVPLMLFEGINLHIV